MRAKPVTLTLLLVCALLPFTSDATPPPAALGNLGGSFTTDLFPGGTGDEDFFTVPGGPPSVMVLLDSSGSMLDFPQALRYPTSPALTTGHGTCAVPEYADAVSARSTAGQHTFEQPFNFTGGSSNSPSWVTTGATGNGCLGGASGACLFKPTAFYRYRPDPASPAIIPLEKDWDENSATERQNDSSTNKACNNLTGTNLTACQTCLTSSGYYLYVDESGNKRAAFSGAFLNVFPPKFIQARKVLKDILSIDPHNPSNVDTVRFGLTTFSTTGGNMVKPLAPSCTDAISSTAPTNFATARTALITALDGVVFGGVTPLANALFNVGQYFSDGATSAGTSSQWLTWFPSNWSSSFWNGAGSVSGNATSSVCWKCQQSSILIVTDGAPKDDNALPNSSCGADHTKLFDATNPASCNGDFRRWLGGTLGTTRIPIDCPGSVCGFDEGNASQRNLLHLVAGFLHYNDLWPDATNSTMSGPQSVTTYTISINLDPASVGAKLLQKTADLGGGFYVNSTNADELADAVFNAVGDVVTKTTSFSVSNTATLQASTAAQLFTARFRPLDRLEYEGHLYRFNLFNEFAEGCDSTKTHAAQRTIACGNKTAQNVNIDGSVSGTLATCDGFYVVDADCDPVVEDATTGAFKKGTFSGGVLSATTTDAVPFWDAGSMLSDSTARAAGDASTSHYRSADEGTGVTNARKIYTVVDNNSGSADGKFTSGDSLVEFTVANVDSLMPYLAVNGTWCKTLYDRLGFTVPGSWGNDDLRDCAKQVIYFIRGYDVLDEDDDGCAGPLGLGATKAQNPKACASDADCSPGTSGMCASGRCTCAAGAKGEERDRAAGHWKLGDIFHSSPQAVDPPYNEFICDLARGQTQCVATIHSPKALTRETQTDIAVDSSNVDAYEQWRRATPTGATAANRDRRRLVLAGANDGMLHAFDAGSPDTSGTRDAFGSYPYTNGSGEELWAFIPPDLLPRLKFALDGHQYFVDGDVMVRDIWVDGGADGTGTKDHTKQSSEFHTIAILSERSGGSQFVALDVTNPLVPAFRWIFPQVCTIEQALTGQSWSDFSPRAPPIGPVKLALPGGAADGLGRTFEERWITMLSGGYDPGGARGRGVWMLDAWTGATLWKFTDADFQTLYGSGSPGSMFPVAATPALVDIGTGDQATLDSDGYFDTATWGDLGGQLWVARFKEPGTLSNGLVTNWWAGRAMEELRSSASDDTPHFSTTGGQYRSEFYRMTANMWDPENAMLRTFLGSGNRERLLTVGATCGPSNVIGCAQANCTSVTVTDTTTLGTCAVTSRFQDSSNALLHSADTQAGAGCSATALDCTTGVSASVTLHLAGCNGSSPPDMIASLSCDSNGSCQSCDSTGANCIERNRIGKSRNLSTRTWPASTSHNRFYGVVTYSGARKFSTSATAKAFDQNRFTDVACSAAAGNTCAKLVDVTQADVSASGVVSCASGTTCAATASDPGWFYEYGDKCPIDGTCPNTSWTDEKTGSGATVLGHCVDWNSIRPMGAAVSGTPCQFGSGTPQNFTYLADSVTGVPSSSFCGFQATPTSAIVRAASRTSVAPPLDATAVISLSPTGAVRQSLVQIEPGSLTSHTVAQKSELSRTSYWLEVPRDLHACRHADATVCE